MTPLSYRVLARLGSAAVRIGNRFSPKLKAGDSGRRSALRRWEAWASAHRDPARPLVWFHAPSVGEGLQAEEVLTRLRARHPDWQLLYSHFSPSAIQLASRQQVDYADFLPYDIRPNVDRLLTALRPQALVFTKLDLWPELASRAEGTGVEVGMVAATVSPVSGRLHPIARRLTAAGYASLGRIGAIDYPDASRLAELGCQPERIRVLGDPRFDSAARHAAAIEPNDPLHRLTTGAPTLVAGSTWPEDEAVLLAAYQMVRSSHPTARLVLVPHEPTPRHLQQLEARGSEWGVPVSALSRLGAGDVPALLVADRVGILATLYAQASVAFVGGGFATAGLHSVLEPAACGVPVLFGPRWQSSREAGLLIAAKGGHALTTGEVGTAARELAAYWGTWLADPAGRDEAGRQARAVVNRGLGAADRCAALVDEMVR